MSDAFVWFHNSSKNAGRAASFYESLLGWRRAEGPPGMILFSGDTGPFAAVECCDDGEGATGWIPYVQVDNVDTATATATQLGATVVHQKARGPAGEFSIVRDPGGAAIALWQKA